MPKRDESLPRVSELIKFISAEEFEAIPADILEEAAAEGTRKHDLIQNEYQLQSNNPIVQMFMQGLKLTLTQDDLTNIPSFEEQINGEYFTGKPDFSISRTVIDYKFSNDLRPQTALQLIFYGMLITEKYGIYMDRFYAFHYPTDHGLFIYKIPDRSVEPSREFAEYIIDNHTEIDSGGLERYEALSRWDKLQEDYELFEPAGTVLPPLAITNENDAIAAALFYYKIGELKKYEKNLKSELVRYMEMTGENYLKDASGYGVRMQTQNNKLYNTYQKARAKAEYDKALEKCQTGTIQSTSLVRCKPPTKKPKLIK